MNSRERVAAALAHREPDRTPRDLGGTESSGMTAAAFHAWDKGLARIFEPFQYVAEIGPETRARARIDTVNLTPWPRRWKAGTSGQGFPVSLPELWKEEPMPDGSTIVRAPDGTPAALRPAGGHYFEPAGRPLAGASTPGDIKAARGALAACDWPWFADEPLDAMGRRAANLAADGGCVVLNLCCHLLAAGQQLRGFENFLMDLAADRPMADALLNELLDVHEERIERLAPVLAKHVDVVLLNDDLGTQNGPMLSPELYREALKPFQRRLFAAAKRHFGKPLLFHSCGSVAAFIPDLVEIGVDALNPVQLSAAGMDIRRLKRDFGSALTFWGGGVDTRDTLNHGTPSEVKDEVRRNVDILAPGGGFVFCQVHNIQPDVPPENVAAMFEALDEP